MHHQLIEHMISPRPHHSLCQHSCYRDVESFPLLREVRDRQGPDAKKAIVFGPFHGGHEVDMQENHHDDRCKAEVLYKVIYQVIERESPACCEISDHDFELPISRRRTTWAGKTTHRKAALPM